MSYADALATFENEPSVRILFEQGGNPAYAPGTPEPNFTATFDSWPINPVASVDRYVLGSGTLTPETHPAPAEGDDQFVADPTTLPATFYSGDGVPPTPPEPPPETSCW